MYPTHPKTNPWMFASSHSRCRALIQTKRRRANARRLSDTQSLPRVELDERGGVDRERHVGLHRRADHATGELVRRVQRDVARQAKLRTALDVLDELRALARLRRHGNAVARLREVAGTVHLLAVHAHVAVRDELARGRDRRRESHAGHDVVQATLENAEQVVARAARQLAGEREITAELAFAHSIVEAHLLLLLEQATELAGLSPARLGLTVLTGGIWLLVGGLTGKSGKLHAETADDLQTRATLWHLTNEK